MTEQAAHNTDIIYKDVQGTICQVMGEQIYIIRKKGNYHSDSWEKFVPTGTFIEHGQN